MDVRVYDQARTAHFERMQASSGEVRFIFRRISYDFDHALASSANAQRYSRFSTVIHLLKNDYRVAELNEPLFMAAWPSTMSFIAAIRIRDFFRRRRTLIVAYAIENIDLYAQFSNYTRLPRAISMGIVGIVSRIITAQYDRLAFGTGGSFDIYRSVSGLARLRVLSKLFLALPSPCERCRVEVKEPDAVVFIGAFEKRKGIFSLLNAWPLVRKANKKANLYLLGKGKYSQEVREWAEKNEVDLIIDPPRSEIHSRLSKAKALVLLSESTPRWREQVGLPIVEGLSHGCEIIATEETGLADYLSSEHHSIVKDPSNPDAVAHAILGALSSRRLPNEIIDCLPVHDSRQAAEKWLYE